MQPIRDKQLNHQRKTHSKNYWWIGKRRQPFFTIINTIETLMNYILFYREKKTALQKKSSPAKLTPQVFYDFVRN